MSTLLVMAGGTGGHVYPALAVADFLRARDVNVVWLGTHNGLEAKVIPPTGIEMEWVSIRGLRGHGVGRWLTMPWLLLRAMAQTIGVIFRRRPDALLGMGGFVAGPGGLSGWLLRKPLVIHEQNAVAGTTNRWLARMASKILSGFPAPRGLPATAEFIGNPVRQDIAAIDEPRKRLAGRDDEALRLLIVGGSQGAQVLNETLPLAVANFPASLRPQIWHQCGRDCSNEVAQAYQKAGIEARADDFIDNMAAAYAWADVVVCRSGAMTVAELAASGSASILVPYPHAIDDHQTANARFLQEQGAALLMPQTGFTAQSLYQELSDLAADRGKILDMALKAKASAKTDATEQVASYCLEAMRA